MTYELNLLVALLRRETAWCAFHAKPASDAMPNGHCARHQVKRP
jgi:hypothetical protein